MAVDVDRVESTLYVPFQKCEDMPDGSVMVYGLVSGPEVDIDGQKMDPNWLKKAMPEWLIFGNIREMHQPKAVGKAQEYQWTNEGPYISAKIIDREAAEKVRQGVYSGFSIGVKNAKIVPDPEAPKGRVVDGKIIEVSIVDYPAYPKAKFDLVKAAETGGWRDMQTGAIIEKEVQAENEGLTPDTENVEPDIEKRVWSTAYINDLPDDCFAYIEPGGRKDEEGKTVPRSLRHLPYKDHTGKIDPAHVRNALQRLPQTKIPEEAKRKAKKKLIEAARKVGIKVSDDTEREVKKEVDLSPQAEAQDANNMGDIIQEIQGLIPKLKNLIEREQSEVLAGDSDDKKDVAGLKETLDNLTSALQSLVTVWRHERMEAGQTKTITTASGLSAYNLDGRPKSKKTNKAAEPDIRKVGRKMAKQRLDKLINITAQFKDIVSALEELARELGATSFEGGESNMPDNPGGKPLMQTRHQEPSDIADVLGALRKIYKAAQKDADISEDADLAEVARALKTLKDCMVRKDEDIAEDADIEEDADIMEDADLAEVARALRVLKDADIMDVARLLRPKRVGVKKDMDVAEMAKSIGEAVAQSLAKAGLIQSKQEDESKEDELLKKFNELEKRLKRIENQPAETQAVAIPVERRHALNPDVKKKYDDTVSTLAKQVSELSDKEREKLAAEIIKMINSSR